MPRRKPPEQIEPEWQGFPERLRYAVKTRQKQEPALTQNKIADLANYDSGNLSKLLDEDNPLKWEGLSANAMLAFARALRVHPLWLLMGIEPTGLAEPREATVAASIVHDSKRPAS